MTGKFIKREIDFMAKAAEIARENVNSGRGGPFGAVIVLKDEIIGYGHNKVISNNDPTAHAEIEAIRNACSKINNFNLTGCEIYSSCEPCPMCFSAILWARLSRIYYSNSRWDAARIGFDDAEIYEEVEKKMSERKISMIHLPSDIAAIAFQEWDKKIDKIKY